MLAVYVDGFAALAASPALEGRWPEAWDCTLTVELVLLLGGGGGSFGLGACSSMDIWDDSYRTNDR